MGKRANKTSPDLQPGKVAVITGAGSGIGRALAVALGERGLKLALADLDEVALAETVALLPEGTAVHRAVYDVSLGAPAYQLARDVGERFGGADAVFNNAGVAIAGSVMELTSDEIAWVMGVNFWGVVHGTKAFLPGMVAQKRGTIANISSVFGLWAPAQNAAYAASKFAVRGFTESLRGEMKDVADGNLRIATVHPGGIRTNIAKRSRFAAAADQELTRRRRDAFDRSALTIAPEEAARVIIAGLDAGKERILIGRETFVIDGLVRVFGNAGIGLINASLRRRTPKELRR